VVLRLAPDWNPPGLARACWKRLRPAQAPGPREEVERVRKPAAECQAQERWEQERWDQEQAQAALMRGGRVSRLLATSALVLPRAPGPVSQALGLELQALAPALQAPGPELQAPGPESQAPGPESQAPGPESQVRGPELWAPGEVSVSREPGRKPEEATYPRAFR